MVLKRRFFCCVLILLTAGMMVARAAASAPAEGYIRLHVLANDDGRAAQALKLEVRDAVLGHARQLLADCGDADEAWRRINDDLEALSEAAEARARAAGYEGPVAARTGVFAFPDRRYGGELVPAGDYRALRVVIGAGEGRNWWCVLYPALCLAEDCDPGEPVSFHSTLLDWLRRLFGGEPAAASGGDGA